MVRCYHLYIMSLGLFLARSRHSILRTCSSRNRIFANAFTLNSRARISFNKLTTTSHVPRIGSIDTTLRHLSTQSNDDHSEDHVKKKKTSKGKARKFTINKNVGPEAAEALAAAFDDLARKDGFDGSMARMADDETFEDAFEDEDFLVMDDEEEDDDDDDDDGIRFDDEDDILDIKNFDVSDFDEETVDKLDDDDDFLDFGGDRGDSMEARIAAAQQDMISGRVTVPEELDRFSSEEVDLSKLGFEREMNPFGNDETPRKEQFKLITNASTCSACGSDFQKRNENLPGYLPPEKFDLQQKLAKIEEMQKLKEKAETSDWSPEDEVEYLIQTAGNPDAKDDPELVDIDIDAMADEMGLDLVKLASKKVICKRCHGLQNFGKVDDALRPGWSEEPTISQEKFRDLLKPISEKPAVVVALVDLFDFSGSVLRELDGIAGENPVILAANKVDLLPASMGKQRIENWVRRELEYVGVKSIANVGGAVRLVSCRTGSGVQEMLAKARSLAEDIDGDVYVVGAANAGKSTLINKILEVEPPSSTGKKMRAGNRNSFKGELTTSPLPGTTLKFIKVDIGDGKSLYDTPGLLVPGTLTQLLTAEELKIVCPKKRVEPITFRVASGKCVLVGGLAKIEVIGDSKPFLLTFFVANDIKLHPTDSARAEDFIARHAGGMLTPPLEPGPERIKQIGEFEEHIVDIEGMGWKEAAADITLAGLGWVAVTGAGSVQIKISVPKGIGISVRPPLMPFDIWEAAAKYTGSKAVRKSSKSKTGKRRKGVGRN